MVVPFLIRFWRKTTLMITLFVIGCVNFCKVTTKLSIQFYILIAETLVYCQFGREENPLKYLIRRCTAKLVVGALPNSRIEILVVKRKFYL